EEFVNQVFSMKIGEYKLIESNTGFHIVRITDQIDKKFLKLDDQINPQEQLTVRQFVSQNLLKMKQQKVFVLVTERVIEELKESAEITLYTNNLGW
ncbi:MAG: peptidylprolyl isomerase, partial [Deltaproteobacteria bacterium]|nr:peptidylprolyl isomerase [Deltaproteobacteria bacterium]